MYSDNYSSWDPNKIDPLLLYSYVPFPKQPISVNLTHTYASAATLHIDGFFVSDKKNLNITYPEMEVYIVKPLQFPQVSLILNQESAIDLAYMTQIDSNNLELESAIKFKKFNEVSDIYIQEDSNLTIVRVLINLDKYNYNLMTEIFNTAEFPLRDKFERDRLIDFQYVYNISGHITPIEYFGKRIFHRE